MEESVKLRFSKTWCQRIDTRSRKDYYVSSYIYLFNRQQVHEKPKITYERKKVN